MRKVFFALVILLTPVLYAQQGCEKNFIDQNYIEVTGKAEQHIIPDMIYISIVLNEEILKKPVQEKETEMIKILKDLGIDVAKNLKVNDLLSIYRSKFFGKDIVAIKKYKLMVNSAKLASEVIEKLDKVGISDLSIIAVDNSKMDEYRRETKIEAAKLAKEKASELANAVGQNIGRALYIQELNTYQNRSLNSNAIVVGYGTTKKVSLEDVPLEYQDIIIEYSVLCRFELK